MCITGGIMGVGMCEGLSRGVNWKFFGKQFASWVATLFVVGLGVAGLFAQVRGCLVAPADSRAASTLQKHHLRPNCKLMRLLLLLALHVLAGHLHAQQD